MAEIDMSSTAKQDGSSPTSKQTMANLPRRASEDQRYGWFTFRPRWLQWLNNIIGAVVVASFANFLQSMTSGLLGVVVSSIEKQFDLTSSQSAWIASGYEIGALPILLLCSLFGTRIHRPLSMAVGLLSVALGCVLFFIPQFVSPPYVPQSLNNSTDSLCHEDKSSSSICESDPVDSLSNFLPMFIIARLMIGMGAVPIYTVAINFIDDCSTREKSATYCAILLTMGIVGPTLGFVSGATSLELFTDFYQLSDNEKDIDTKDSRWIGAWWLPYTFTAALCLITMIPMSGFSRDLPGAAEIRSRRTTEAHNTGTEKEKAEETLTEKSDSGVFQIAKSVLTNPTCMFLSLFSACDNFLVAGFTAFGPKYFQFGFGLGPTFAGIIFGAVLLPAGAGGTIVAGLVIEKLKLSCHQIMKLMTILASATAASTLVFLLFCKTLPFSGVNVSYNSTVIDNVATLSLNDTCNSNCRCDAAVYDPICSHDNVQYYSPCYAGCLVELKSSEKTNYHNCSCITPATGDEVIIATAGICTSGVCTNAIVFFTIFFFSVFMIFFCITANVSATLRCVTGKQTAFAIAFQILIVKTIGTIPGPLLMGVAFDNTCILWQPLGCRSDSRGSCQFYNNSDLARNFLIISLSVKCVSFVAVLLATILYKPPKVVSPDSDNSVKDVTCSTENIRRPAERKDSVPNNNFNQSTRSAADQQTFNENGCVIGTANKAFVSNEVSFL